MKKVIFFILGWYWFTACGTQDKPTAEHVASASPSPGASGLESGRDGQNGKDGKDGKDGTNGRDGRDVSTNEWYDDITSKHWFMGAQGTQSAAISVCTSSYRVPTAAELSDACYRGLFKAYQAQLAVAPQTASWAYESGMYVNTGTCLSNSQATGISSTIVCIEK